MTRAKWGSVLVLGAFLGLPMVAIIPPLLLPLTFHHWVQALTAWVVIAALPAALAFPLLYAATAAWWRTHLGRAVMMLSVGIGWIVITAAARVLREWPHVAHAYAGDPVNVDLTRLAGYSWVMIAVYYILGALWVVSRRGSDLHTDDAEVRSHTHDDHHSSEDSSV